MGVQRHGQHIGAVVEDALGAVAMMQVDIQNGDLAALQDQLLGGDGGVVQVAKAARNLGKGVVTGGAAQGIGGLALEQQFRRMDGTLRRGIGGNPGVGADGGRSVGDVEPGLTHGAEGITVVSAGGVDVGDHLGRGTVDAAPSVMDVTQEGQIAVRVDGGDGVHAVVVWLLWGDAQPVEAADQRVDPRGLFRAGPLRA